MPNADSRVTLTGERDAYGLPRLQVDWRLHPQDIDSLVRKLPERIKSLRAPRFRRKPVDPAVSAAE